MRREREENERVWKRKRGDREGWEEKERRVRGLEKIENLTAHQRIF